VTDTQDNKAFWESEAQNWTAWAREPNHDDYWNYAPVFFRDIVPEPSGLTLEVGCGEGRVTRDLRGEGHDVVSIDAAPSLLKAAAEADPDHRRYALADAAALPILRCRLQLRRGIQLADGHG
jgi:SAM-dependent methyltransferase